MHLSSQLLILFQQLLLKGLLFHEPCLLSSHLFLHELYLLLDGQELLGVPLSSERVATPGR